MKNIDNLYLQQELKWQIYFIPKKALIKSQTE